MQPGEERVPLISQVTVHHRGKLRQEVKAEIWRQELQQKPWRDNAYCFAFSCLLSLPSHTSQAHLPKDGTSHSALGPLISTINKILHRHAHKSN